MKWVFLILLLAVLLIGTPIVLNFVERGKQVTSSTKGSDGIVEESPDELAAQAGVDVDTYSLARAISSEEETKTVADPNYLIGVAWVIANEANARGLSLTSLLTSSSRGGGQYGRQSVGPRYAATYEDPYERDIGIARGILSGTIPDITNGSRHFFAPKTQDILHSRDPSRYKSADEIDQKWQSEGYTSVEIENVDPDKLRFYRKV